VLTSILPEAGPPLAELWEDRRVLRVLSSVASAALGGMLGYVARQRACRRGGGSGRADELVVTVPVGATAAAALVGVVAGRKAAFLSGLVLGAAVGRKLDRFVPGLGDLGGRADPLASEGDAPGGEETPPASGVA
jgi:hypothetical protein